MGGRTTLTFTIDNTLNASRIGNLDFVDSLPNGLVVADPSNASSDCISAGLPDTTITAVPGTGVITLNADGTTIFAGFEVLPAGATCTVNVDVKATGAGALNNITGDLLADFSGVGKASDTLQATVTPLALSKDFTDDPVAPGGNVTLEFTVRNFDRNSPATSVAFTDDLTTLVPTVPGMTFNSLLSNDCGGSVSGVGGTSIGLTGGTLSPEGSCTIRTSLSVPAGATPGSYTSTSSAVTGIVAGSPVIGNAASEKLFIEPTPLLTLEFLDATTLTSNPVLNPGDEVVIRYSITNPSTTSAATDITFIDELTNGAPLTGFLPFPLNVTLPPVPNPACGAGSSIATVFLDTERQGLSLTGGSLTAAPGAGSLCVFDVKVTLPANIAAGTYTSATQAPTATIDGTTRTGSPVSAALTVIAAPSLNATFIDDPIAPGGTVTLEFTLSHSQNAPTDATAITFTNDLSGVLAGLTANFPAVPDPVCGVGSSLAGSAGDTLLTLMNGTLAPGEECTFSITLDVPAGTTPGTFTNTTSGVNATVNGVAATSAPASDDLTVTGLLFSKEYLTNPVIAGQTTTLRFTIDNISPTDDATTIDFDDNLAQNLSGLAATGPATQDTCGGSLTGTTFLVYTGGSVLSGQSCTIEVEILVPAAAADGNYANITSSLTASQGSGAAAIDPATDTLMVSSALLALNKEFIDDPVTAGGTATLVYEISNLDATQTASSIAFTDNLGAVITGLEVSSLQAPSNCQAGGAVIAGLNSPIFSVSSLSLAPGASCTILANVAVPASAASGVYTSGASALSGTVNGLPVNGPAATDDLTVVNVDVDFNKVFGTPPAKAGETTTLEFTISNNDSMPLTRLSFTDDLDAVISGLVASGLPINNVCGAGSVVSGSSTVSLIGGSLPANGSCTFSVDVSIPVTAAPGNYVSTSSELTEVSLNVADAAVATLTVLPTAPLFSSVFNPNVIAINDISELRFTIDNSASVVAASALDFTNSLPAGLTIASPANTVVSCTGGTLTAVAGTSTISYTAGSVAATSTCRISVDTVSDTGGVYVNTSGNLTSSAGNSGTATATLTVDDDLDDDNVKDSVDNCPAIANPDQADLDRDGQGNACDSDDDGDGMPDEFEIANGLDPLNSVDQLADPDGDGFTNLEEFQFGTDPNSPDADENDNGIPDVVDQRRMRTVVPNILFLLLLDDYSSSVP